MTTSMPDFDGMALAPEIKADGSELPETWLGSLLELRVRRALRTIGRCTLRFTDPGYTLASASRLKVGAKLQVSAKGSRHGSKATVVFTGIVTSTGVGYRDGGQPELEVVAEDAAFALARSARAKTFLKLTASDIITNVVRAAGASPKVDATSQKLEYTLQTDTDLAFVDELCRRNGMDWEVDGTTFQAWRSHNGTDLGGSAPSPGVSLTATDDLLSFSAKVHADAPDEVVVRGWDHLNKQDMVGKATLSRTTVPAGLRAWLPGSALSKATVLDTRSAPSTASEATSLATLDAAATGTVVARGRAAVVPELRPGVVLSVADAGPASGSYYVREVEHSFRPEGFTTTFVAGDRDPGSLASVGLGGPRSSFVHEGLVTGTVSAIEKDPEAAGRVKVSLPGLDTTIESQWARLAVLGGGAQRGMVFLPEVGDEVLVGFEGDDIRRPVVLGGLFGKKDAIPTDLAESGKVTRRRITSRLGHVVELADGSAPKDQRILLALAGEKISLNLSKERADLTLPDGVPLAIKVGSSSIEFDGRGAIKISGTTIDLKAEQNLTLEGVQVTAKASAKFAASGAQAEVKADSMATVQSGGITAVKGSMVQIN